MSEETLDDEYPDIAEAHAITRARERYGLELTMRDLRLAKDAILNGESLMLSKTPFGVSQHIMRIGGVAVRVAVGTNGNIKTFLPMTNAPSKKMISRIGTPVPQGRRKRKKKIRTKGRTKKALRKY